MTRCTAVGRCFSPCEDASERRVRRNRPIDSAPRMIIESFTSDAPDRNTFLSCMRHSARGKMFRIATWIRCPLLLQQAAGACGLSLSADGLRIREEPWLQPRYPHLHDARPPAGHCMSGTGQPFRGEATIATKSGPGGLEAQHHQLERSNAWAASRGGPSRTRGCHIRRALPTRCHRQTATCHRIGQGPCRRADPRASRRAPESTPRTRAGGGVRSQRQPADPPRFRQLRHRQPQERLDRRSGARRHRK